jgi:tetratricopeptide (TPR) repeat protein/tRNA A-37 threonylcarbamoyl transferase component Bud32
MAVDAVTLSLKRDTLLAEGAGNDQGRLKVNADSNASIPPSPLPKAGRPIFGDYQVEGELGRGGMGVVFRARQKKLNRLVALKMLTGHYGPDELARFRAEAETAASLHHTNIVQIYEVGEDQGAPFFSMEYVESGSLADRLRAGMLPAREAAQLLISVARALHFAHQNGVVHRDMKPANVLLDPDGVPKVTDFGIAKRLSGDSSLTLSGVVIGTPTYMAPEQAKGTSRGVGTAADIYSLGAILYEILAGRPPFLPEESETAIMVRVITEDPVSPAWHRPGIPRDLETICLRCLEKEPRDRYSSAAAFAEDLRRFLEDESILARPPTTAVRTVKWIKRHPWRFVAGGALALALAAAGQRLWQWEFYQRPHVEYAAAVDYVRGGFEPILKMDEKALSHHGVSLRLTRRGRIGPITRVEVLNSRGNPAVLRPIYPEVIPIYLEGLMGTQPYAEKAPESTRIEFSYNGETASEATALDRNGNPIWRIIYDRPVSSPHAPVVIPARFANLRGFAKSSTSGASQMEIERDANGRDVKVSFFNGEGKPAANGEGVYGYKLERDAAGRIVRLFNLGQDGQPAANNAGQISLAMTWGPAGRVVRIDMCDGAGKPAAWNGVSAMTIDYDALGNLIGLVRLGADGKPARGIDWTVQETQRNERGEIIGHKFLKIGLDGATSPFFQWKVAYDELGHPSDLQFAGTIKWRTAMLHDASGNVTEEKYLDAEGRASAGEIGYLIKRRAYKSSRDGFSWEETYFDAAGAKTYCKAGYHRMITEFDPNGALRRQTREDEDPTRFRYYRDVSEPEYDSQGRLRRSVLRFENEKGQLAVDAGLPYAAIDETYDENGRVILTWQLGCAESAGSPDFRIDAEWHKTGARKRQVRQACDVKRQPIGSLSSGVFCARKEEDFDEIDRPQRIYETGFNEKLVGFSVREAKFAEGKLQSVTHKRGDGTALDGVRVIVTGVAPEQPKAAELKAGDELLSANGNPIRSAYDWSFNTFPGGWIEVKRDGKTMRVEGFTAGKVGLLVEDRALDVTPYLSEADKLEQEIKKLYQAGKYAEAVPFALQLLDIREKTFGPEHLNTALTINNLANFYSDSGDYAKAEPLYQRSLKIREKVLGPEDPKTADSLNDLAALYDKMGYYAKAEPLYQRSLNIREKALGPEHPDTANSLNNLATLYDKMGDYAKAEPLYQRSLKIREKALGPEDPDIATSLNNLAGLYVSMGSYAKAEPLYQRSLKIREKTLGPEHPNTANSLNNLAELYDSMGDYAKAEPLYQHSLAINEKTLGPEHQLTATSLNNLAEVYKEMGDYARAEPLLQRSLKINEKALGPEHPNTANTLHNLADLYDSMGDYAKAEPLYQRSLAIIEKALGSEHPSTANSLNSLAAFYVSLGDYAKAEPLYQRSLGIREKVLGLEHSSTALSLNNLGELYREMGDYAKAESLYQRSLKIFEKVLGPEHPSTALSLNNLAELYTKMGDYAKAEPLYQRSLQIREKALGPEHPDTALSLNNLAGLYHRTGDYAKAEPLYQRSLKIIEKVLGPDHPNTAASLNNLALLYGDMGNAQEQLRLAQLAQRAEEKTLSNILSFTSEQQRLAFQKTTRPYTLPAILGNGPELAQLILRRKGIVLDSLLEDRLVAETSTDPRQRETINQLRAAKQQLMQLLLQVPKDISETVARKRETEKKELARKVEELEGGLGRQVAGLGRARRALSLTVAQVQTALGPGAALIEFLRYESYQGKNKFEPRYGAVVIASGSEPKWIPLGAAAEIEKKILLYKKSVRGQTNEAALSAVLKKLDEEVWAPIVKECPAGIKTMVVSPDAELNFVSFATLLTPDDRFLGEEFSIRYVASGRDLLRETKPVAAAKTSMQVFANPDFAAKSDGVTLAENKTNTVTFRSIEIRELQSISLPELPGTARESAKLEECAKKSGWQAHLNLGEHATEAELRKVNSPRILHLATHGFFLPEIDLGPSPKGLSRTTADIPKGKLVNPMHRSGLAVAGAQTTLHAWAKGEVPPTENDGIVTAEEVGGLKLDGTWLVVLSACDTGSGEAKAGEGVMGLRRGFVQAGTQNLLMTLWPISDEITVQIMLDFYDAAFKTGNAPQALADTQRDWLVKLRKEKGLLAAVRLAGPFIMSSQGKP